MQNGITFGAGINVGIGCRDCDIVNGDQTNR